MVFLVGMIQGFFLTFTGAVVASALWLVVLAIFAMKKRFSDGAEIIVPCLISLWLMYVLVTYGHIISIWVAAYAPIFFR